MRRLVLTFLLWLPLSGFAAGGHNPHIEAAPIDLQDRASLQRGARLFVNYCMGCHSLKYLRYERMAEDLGIPRELAMQYLNFTDGRIGDPMVSAMDTTLAAQWFGVAPPDLSLTTRLRSPDWVYSYLIKFVEDPSRPYGYDNLVFPSVGMPHVMAHMEDALGEDEFRKVMLDITNFLTYAAEPIRLERERLGVYVLIFLFILFWPAYFLKREYWKDVH